MYAKTCSQPKATPTTKKEPPNQAHTRKPRTDTQKSLHTQDNVNQPKQSCAHTATPKDLYADTVPPPPTTIQWPTQDHPEQTCPHPPRQHTITLPITLPSTQQPSLRALKKIPMCRHRKQGHTHPNQSCADHQTANGRHCTDTENPRKPPRRHSPILTGPHHPMHTKTPTCPHRAPRKPVPRAPLQPRKPPLS